MKDALLPDELVNKAREVVEVPTSVMLIGIVFRSIPNGLPPASSAIVSAT